MGQSSPSIQAIQDQLYGVYEGIAIALWPEEPRMSGDLEEGGTAAKKEVGCGQLQRVWCELSPSQIPHLFIITILAIHAIKAAIALSLGSLAIYSIAMFIVYRDLVTGGFYALAMQALKSQILEVEKFKEQNTTLKQSIQRINAAGGDVEKAVSTLQNELIELKRVREGLQEDAKDISSAVEVLKMSSTPRKPERGS